MIWIRLTAVRILSLYMGGAISWDGVSAGIHYDGISRVEISRVIELCEEIASEIKNIFPARQESKTGGAGTC